MQQSPRTSKIGRVGEFFVAYVLERQGVECHHVDRFGMDLWCRLPDHRLVTVEVKTCTSPRRRGAHLPNYYFSTNTRTADWYALVALDIEQVLFIPMHEIRATTLRIKPYDFTAERCVESVERFLGKKTPAEAGAREENNSREKAALPKVS